MPSFSPLFMSVDPVTGQPTAEFDGIVIAEPGSQINGTIGRIQTATSDPRIIIDGPSDQITVTNAAGQPIAQIGGQAVPLQFITGVGATQLPTPAFTFVPWTGAAITNLTLIAGRQYFMVCGGSVAQSVAGTTDDMWIRAVIDGQAGAEARAVVSNSNYEANLTAAMAWTPVTSKIGTGNAHIECAEVDAAAGGNMLNQSGWIAVLALN